MFPVEVEILLAIAANKNSHRKLINTLDVVGEYIGYLHDSLVRRGYLEVNKTKGYQITAKGTKAILDFLRERQDKADYTMKKLKQLGVEYSNKMDKTSKAQLAAN